MRSEWLKAIVDSKSYLAFHLVADSIPIALVVEVVVEHRSYQACLAEIAALFLYPIPRQLSSLISVLLAEQGVMAIDYPGFCNDVISIVGDVLLRVQCIPRTRHHVVDRPWPGSSCTSLASRLGGEARQAVRNGRRNCCPNLVPNNSLFGSQHARSRGDDGI